MKAFLATAGAVFALIVIAHVARMVMEPSKAGDAWFWLLTIVAAALSGWAWRLWWQARAPAEARPR
jgi:hypothetical protein